MYIPINFVQRVCSGRPIDSAHTCQVKYMSELLYSRVTSGIFGSGIVY